MNRIALSTLQLDTALGLVVGPARLPCPQCGSSARLTTEPDAAGYGYFTTCSGCYDVDCSGDPPEFRAISPQGFGYTRAESVASWNEAVETWVP